MPEPSKNRHLTIHFQAEAIIAYPYSVMALPTHHFDDVPDVRDIGRRFQFFDYLLYAAAQGSVSYSSEVARSGDGT